MKHDDTKLKKIRCPIKLHGYYMTINVCKFNMLCSVHNQELNWKLVCHLIVGRLYTKKKKSDVEMTLNMFLLKNMKVGET